VYNLVLSEEIVGFDGAAHIETWKSDPAWQGVREVAEQLTAIDDWCEAIFAANVVFEPLVGELFRSHLVQHAAPGSGDFVTPAIVGDGEYDYAQRDLLRHSHVPTAHERPRVRRPQQALLDQWLQAWVPRAISAARTLQPLWSQPDFKPPRFEDGLDRAKSRFSRILSQLGPGEPKELTR
jgi:propane 2-monooxygenase small subunit